MTTCDLCRDEFYDMDMTMTGSQVLCPMCNLSAEKGAGSNAALRTNITTPLAKIEPIHGDAASGQFSNQSTAMTPVIKSLPIDFRSERTEVIAKFNEKFRAHVEANASKSTLEICKIIALEFQDPELADLLEYHLNKPTDEDIGSVVNITQK